MMALEAIRTMRLASPFKPFRMIMRDGRDLPVERSSYLGISPNGRSLTYAAPKGGFEFLRVDDVADVLVDERPQRSGGSAR
jgi:hypothetical protein